MYSHLKYKMGEHRRWYLCVWFIYTQCFMRISALSVHETEGKSCETPSGEPGLCLQLPQCHKVLSAIEEGDRQHTRCGFVGSIELVCCKTEYSSPRTTIPTTTFQSSVLPLHRDFESEYFPTRIYATHRNDDIQENSNTNSESTNKNSKFLMSTETSVQDSRNEGSDSTYHLNEVESETEIVDSRIFLGGNNDRKFLSPLYPFNALKNFATGIFSIPTRTTKINFPLITPMLSKHFPNSETDTEKHYTSHTPSYNVDNWPVSTLKPVQSNPSTSLPLMTTSPTSIFDIIPNEILPPETRPVSATGKNEKPTWTMWETYSSPSPTYDLDDNTPPYYFPLKPSQSSEVTIEENQLSTSSWTPEDPSPSHGISKASPKYYFLPNSLDLLPATTEENPSEHGTSFQGEHIDETTISNILLKPTQANISPTWMSINHNPTTEKTDTRTENPSFSDFYPINRPDLEIPSEQNWRPVETVRPEIEITSDIGSSKNLTIPSALRKSQQACAQYKDIPVLTKYIIGGDYAAHGEFPHMVALGFQKPREANLSWLCGGTLLNEEFVLTAAHCVKTRYGAPVAVRVGFTNLTADWSTGQEVAVSEAIAHPGYDPIARAHDIALLRIASPLQFSQFVLPACLRAAAQPPPGQLTVTGWGSITPDGSTPTDHMKKALVTPTEDATCRIFYPKVFRQEMICAGSEDPVDTCKGDSGGPMQLLEPSSSIYMVVGITSFGPNPCAGDRPGVYTRVASYLTWIERIVWPDFT